MEKELLADAKEIAEHNMLVDLGRNDVGRVSEFGTVKVLDYLEIKKFSHVMHITSRVTGRLRADKDWPGCFAVRISSRNFKRCSEDQGLPDY